MDFSCSSQRILIDFAQGISETPFGWKTLKVFFLLSDITRINSNKL